MTVLILAGGVLAAFGLLVAAARWDEIRDRRRDPAPPEFAAAVQPPYVPGRETPAQPASRPPWPAAPAATRPAGGSTVPGWNCRSSVMDRPQRSASQHHATGHATHGGEAERERPAGGSTVPARAPRAPAPGGVPPGTGRPPAPPTPPEGDATRTHSRVAAPPDGGVGPGDLPPHLLDWLTDQVTVAAHKAHAWAELENALGRDAVAGHLDPGWGGGDSPFTPDRGEWYAERDGDL